MSLSVLDQAKDSDKLAFGAKILNYSASSLGKSHDFIVSAPRPLLVVDSDAQSNKFADGRFEKFKGVTIFDLPVLQATLDDLLGRATRKGEGVYQSVAIDSLTVIIDGRIRDLGIDASDAEAAKRGQATFAREVKQLAQTIRRLSAVGIHVCVTSEERNEYEGGEVKRELAKAKSSLSVAKWRYLFDFVYRKTARDIIVVDKSRYVDWAEKTTYGEFDATVHLGPMFAGTAKRHRGVEAFNPATAVHEQLIDLLRSRGSQGRGGVIPDQQMSEYIALAHSDEDRERDVLDAIAEIDTRYPAAATAASRGAPGATQAAA